MHSRSFGRPRTLDAGERVWLVIGPSASHLRVRVNGHHIGDASTGTAVFEADITSLLAPRNELLLEGDAESPPDVALEIRGT